MTFNFEVQVFLFVCSALSCGGGVGGGGGGGGGGNDGRLYIKSAPCFVRYTEDVQSYRQNN